MMSYMAQITIYLPDPIEREVRRAARKAGTSVSAYIAALARKTKPAKRRWSSRTLAALGGAPELCAPDDPVPEPVAVVEP